MGIADIQAAFGQPAPAAATPLQVFQPQPATTMAPAAPAPAMQVPLGYRPIRTAFGDALLPDSAPLPPGAQYLDPATGQPYPPLNPPGEAQALAPVASPQVAAVAPQNQASPPSPFLAPPQATPLQAVEQKIVDALTPTVVLPADPAPKGTGRTRTRRGSSASGANAPTQAAGVADVGADAAAGGDGLGAFSTEDLRDELKRRGWQVALGEAQ